MLFLHLAHDWKNEKSLMENLLNSNNPLKWAMFVMLSVSVFPLIWFMYAFFEKWNKLQD